MIWRHSFRADPVACAIADRHYNRQSVGAPQFVPPGRCLVLLAPRALWVTSWPLPQYVKHRWAGAWVCSLFRNEGEGVASELIRQAIAATRAEFGDPPALGMVTFVNPAHVKPTMVRGKATWGWTWLKAGFERDGETRAGLPCFRLRRDRMPAAEAPHGKQLVLA
jgi:hypothetical protein